MKFIFDLLFWMVTGIILILFLAYNPLKTFTFVGIFLAICVVIGVTIGIWKIKK